MGEENKKEKKESFSDDPEQNIRIENKIIKLKMQAERGAFFGSNMEALPPELEAEFLRNVQQFEDSFDKTTPITIYECIGQPEFKKAAELKPEEVKAEISRIIEMMQSKNIILEVLGQYDHLVIYKFITEELFQEKIREVNYTGYIHNFIYEEFHPNHKIDISKTAQEFLNHWFEKEFGENSIELAGQLITAGGKIFSRQEVLEKLQHCLNRYHRFINIKFKETDTAFEWDEKEGKGIGHAEGMFSYDAEIERGETIHIEGPFKLYMINETGLWKIFYFVFPGFSW